MNLLLIIHYYYSLLLLLLLKVNLIYECECIFKLIFLKISIINCIH